MFIRIAHSVGIYPHDGKRVIFIKDGQFCSGEVIGSRALTGHTPLSELPEESRLKQIIEAANSLRVPPFRIEKRLSKGEMVTFRPRKEGR